MKVKLLVLLGLTALPFVPVAQGQNPVFFNKGKMSVVGDGSTKTVMYVDGDFVVSRDPDNPAVKSDILVNNSQIILKGDFVQNAPYVAGTNANVFSYPTSGYIPSELIFQGDPLNLRQQKIRTDLAYDPMAKGSNYIDFPTIIVDNPGTVLMSPEIAADAKRIDLKQGRFILDSRRLMSNEVPATSAGASSYYSILAHLMVNKNAINYANIPLTIANEDQLAKVGTVQVRLALDPTIDKEIQDNPGLTAQQIADLKKNRNGRSIVGMGSPFKKISSDYFTWNHLMIPYQNNIIGSTGDAETSPYVVLPSGKGFVAGIDLKGNDINEYKVGSAYTGSFDTSQKIKDAFDQRAKDGYVFDRFSFNSLNNVYPLSAHSKKNDKFGVLAQTNASTNGLKPSFTNLKVPISPYGDERLEDGDVSVDLIQGYNYLSNPFMTPLDLNGLLNPVNSNGTPDANWKVSIGGATGLDVYNAVWLLNPSSKASASYNLSTGVQYGPTSERIFVSYSYLVAASVGGTYVNQSSPNNFGTIIAPLQMFIVYANKTGAGKSITIPANQRRITEAPSFLRSAITRPGDDFYIEVLDEETKIFDRTAIVLRSVDELQKNSKYMNIAKMLTVVTDAKDNADFSSTTKIGSVSGNLNSMLYTKDDQDGSALESNFVGFTPGVAETLVPLYLSPSPIKQKISLYAGRLETMDNVKQIFLEDKLKNKKIELSKGQKYITETSPTDKHDRFNLRFVHGTFGTSGIDPEIDNPSRSIYSYYRDNNLTVAGFEDEDINSTLSIYNIQGQLLDQMKVNQLEMVVPVSYPSGAYIVKVVGKKSYVSKFLVK